MISTQDLYKEIEHYEALVTATGSIDDQQYKKAMIKLSLLNIKLLHNIRTNTVQVMAKFGVDKVIKKESDQKSVKTKV